MSQYLKIPQATSEGYIKCPMGGVFDWAYPTSKLRRGRVQGDGFICPTLTTVMEIYYFEGIIDEERERERERERVLVLGTISPNSIIGGRVIGTEGIAPTITAGTHGYGFGYIYEIKQTDTERK